MLGGGVGIVDSISDRRGLGDSVLIEGGCVVVVVVECSGRLTQ